MNASTFFMVPRYEGARRHCLDGWRKSRRCDSHQWKDAFAMPRRLRPTAPTAAAAVLVGDPGRALLLAQELLDEPKMSNHARGLWGYGGQTADGKALTIQSTGIGGPSAAVVLTDLAKLGLRRAVRVGTATAVSAELSAGDMLVVESARAEGASAATFDLAAGDVAHPDPELSRRLGQRLDTRPTAIASFDTIAVAPAPGAEIVAADMQTATVFACGQALGLAVAALLIVETTASGERISDEALAAAAKSAGHVAAAVL
jgi:uridine phosphorylase